MRKKLRLHLFFALLFTAVLAFGLLMMLRPAHGVGTLIQTPGGNQMKRFALLIFISWLALFAVHFTLAHKTAVRVEKWQGRGRTDPLTGLLGVSALEDEMKSFLKKNTAVDYGLVCLDISAFHRFNTMYGHAVGDKLLKTVGETIKGQYPCGTRVSNDVFMFLSPVGPELLDVAVGILEEGVSRLMGARYLQVVSFKLGVYPLIDEGFDFRKAYDGALLALKTAKGGRKMVGAMYDRKMHALAQMNRNIEVNMLGALQEDEFLIYVQPKFKVSDASCCGGEALVRWQSRQMGFLMPYQFVPLFEQNGFIFDLDLFMLERVLMILEQLILDGATPFPISVNQSRVTISYPDYLERIGAIVGRYRVPLSLVEIEITESALSESLEKVITLVQSLREMGFAVSIDDFGSGYSSLNTLSALPVDTIKIDKEFLRDSDESLKGRKVISSIIGLSKELEMFTVCEGVETGPQFDFLKEVGCDVVQGYYFSKPMPYEEYRRRYLGRQPSVS